MNNQKLLNPKSWFGGWFFDDFPSQRGDGFRLKSPSLLRKISGSSADLEEEALREVGVGVMLRGPKSSIKFVDLTALVETWVTNNRHGRRMVAWMWGCVKRGSL